MPPSSPATNSSKNRRFLRWQSLLEEDTLPLTPEESYVLPGFRLCTHAGGARKSEEKEAPEMFVTISTYQARAGEEDTIVALHEDWQRTLQPKAAGYISGELLRNATNARAFVAIMRFERQEFFQELADTPQQQVWTQRLENLVEIAPVHREYVSEWLCSQGKVER